VIRGDIYLCDFGDPIGHEQGFQRPAVIVSHDEMTRYGLPVVLPVTRTKRGYPTHVEIDGVLPVTSYIQCEQIRTVSTDRMIRPLGSISDLTLMRVEQILRRILIL
jgi:mRNA interferase MazF